MCYLSRSFKAGQKRGKGDHGYGIEFTEYIGKNSSEEERSQISTAR